MKLNGAVRKVYNSVTGQVVQSRWPATRKDAYDEDVAFYYPAGAPPCPDPGNPALGISPHTSGSTSKVYTVSDKQVCCARADAYIAYLEAQEAGEPLTPDERAAAVGYYWIVTEGTHCGHVGKRTIDGKCWECVTGRALRPRQVALRTGAIWYTPAAGDECSMGHLAPRRVANGSCKECEEMGKPVAEVPIYESCPDMVISYEDARGLGFKYYRTGEPCKYGHTGWRYISTRGCMDCKAGK